jgi:hypothetical protein
VVAGVSEVEPQTTARDDTRASGPAPARRLLATTSRRVGRAFSSSTVCGRRACRSSRGPCGVAGNNPCRRQGDQVVAPTSPACRVLATHDRRRRARGAVLWRRCQARVRRGALVGRCPPRGRERPAWMSMVGEGSCQRMVLARVVLASGSDRVAAGLSTRAAARGARGQTASVAWIPALSMPPRPSSPSRRRGQRAPPGVECTEGVGGSAVEAGGFVPGGEHVHDQRERPLTATGGGGIVAR